MSNFKIKVFNFLKNNYAYFIAVPVIFILFGTALASMKIYPFGNAIMASYDLLAQICPFLEHYFSVLDGTSGLFHSFYIGRGMDVFGSIAFCSISPFTFLFLIAGRTNSLNMVSLVLPLKIACASVSAIWFAKKYFKNIPEYIVGAFGVLYALGGYLYVANTYINWVDLMIYMPLLAAGFINFARGKGIKLLAISLALCVYTCFSIACFSFFLIFPIGIAYCLICVEKGEKLKKSAEFAFAFALAVGASLPLLIPSFISYLHAGRNTGIFSTIFTTDAMNFEPLYKKFTYIICDGAFIFFAAMYFIKPFKREKEAKFLLVALLVALFPCVVDESMLLLNFGSYYSYSLRFGFLTGIIIYCVALIGADEFFGDGKVGKSFKIIPTIIILLLSAVAAFAVFVFFNYILNGTFEEGKPFYSYFSSFAHSIGGIEGTGPLLGIFLIVACAACLLLKFKMINERLAAIAMCIVAVSCSGFNLFAMVKGDKQSASYGNIMRYAEINEKLSETNDEYFRIKSYDYYVSADSALIARYYSAGLFSSTADKKNLYLTSLFKYRGNGTNSTRSNGGGVFGDAIMGYKYVVYKSSDKNNAERSYLKDTGIKAGSYLVYENALSFPLASVVKGDKMEFEGLNPVERIGKIYSYLSGGEEGLTELKLTFTENSDGSMKIAYTVPGKSEYWSWNTFTSDMNISFKGSTSKISPYSAYAYLEEGGRRSVTISSANGPLKKEDVEPYFHVSAISLDKIEKLKNILESKKVAYKLVKNGIEFPEKIIAEEGDKLYLSYVDIDGYTAYVNGKKVKTEENGAEFIIIPLNEGENRVELKYSSPYPKYVVIGLLAGAAIVAVILLCKKKYKKIYSAVELPIGVAAVCLAGLLAAFFLAFPLGVYVWKIVLL
ncbi:MAG: YfhO family protein [Clostridia bacterium]|nr:YfhO family protein [Clostridia bacterium]